MTKKLIPLAMLMLAICQGCLPKAQDLLPPGTDLSEPEVPDLFSDFEVAIDSPGARLYQNGVDYVQAIDLSLGASIRFLNGRVSDPGQGKGVYGGNDPKLLRQKIEEAWTKFSQTSEDSFCIANGQFFRNDSAKATTLAFPIKADGKILTDGYAGENEYAQEKMMLEVWSDRAKIKAFEPNSFYASDAPNIIVGLKQDADKGIVNETGRTFIGLKDENFDGNKETVLIFTSESASQPHAAEVLRYFGASEIIMLDGGGSTQLICQGNSYVNSPRTIPQMIGVDSAPSNSTSASGSLSEP